MVLLQYFLLVVIASHFCFGFTLGLDVGHTSQKYGALSSSCEKEYNYNLALVKYIDKKLRQNSDITIFSNIEAQNISFSKRYELSQGKDLFVSIHHDSVQPQYITYDGKHCPQTNYAQGFSIFVSKKNKYYEKSLLYARKFATNLMAKGLKPTLHHSENIDGERRVLLDRRLGIYQFDDLKVLKNAHSPAFLFEAGVIVNPKDEQLVRSVDFRDSIVFALSGFKTVLN